MGFDVSEVVLLENVVNLSTSWHQANNFFAFFSICELGCITKHLLTGPVGNSGFCFSSASMFPSELYFGGALRVLGNQNSLFAFGQVIKCLECINDFKKSVLSKYDRHRYYLLCLNLRNYCLRTRFLELLRATKYSSRQRALIDVA